jgi:PST family polysaccharide transporter
LTNPSTSTSLSDNPPKQHALGRTVGGGMTWMVISTVISKLATALAQGILGWWLLPEEFKSFAYATVAAGFIMLARDASIPNWIIQKGEENWDRLSGPAFHLAFAYNVFTGLIMAALAIPLARYWAHDPKVAHMLWVIALSLPVGTFGVMLQTKMRLDMRFREFLLIVTVSGILRQVSTVVLAWAGFKSMSLSLPIVITAAFESIVCLWYVSDRPWFRRPDFAAWPGIFKETFQLMQATVANFATEWGPYLTLPFLMKDAEGERQVGYYYFGYMIVGQIGAILSNNLFVIIMPALSKLKGEPVRLAAAYLRGLRTLMMAACLACVGTAAIYEPLEHLIWHGKWSPTVPVVVLLAATYPWKATFGLNAATFIAIGRFRRYSLCTWLEGFALVLGAWIAAFVHPTANSVVIGTGIAILIGRTIVMIVMMRTLGQHGRDLARASIPAWLISLIAGIAGVAADRLLPVKDLLFAQLPFPALLDETRISGSIISRFLPITGTYQILSHAFGDVIRCLLAGTTCTVAFMALARVFLAQDLHDVVQQSPARIRAIAQRLVLLKAPEEPVPGN